MFGRRSQLGILREMVQRAETGTPEPVTWANRQPLVNRAGAYLNGLRGGEARRTILGYVHESERANGALTNLHPNDPGVDAHRYGLFVAEKAITLQSFHRTPAQITEQYVDARGSVDGQEIAPRRIFVQTWRAVDEPKIALGDGGGGKLVLAAKPTGKVYVISPGFLETGRNFYAEADALSRAGNDVIVMDHQWAGFSSGGKPGAVDRGFGVARDVAAVAAYADTWAAEHHPNEPKREVVLVGHSMGAGPGVYGAITMNDAGRIKLDNGARMPTGLSGILLAPYFHASPSRMNDFSAKLGKIPGVRNAPLPEYEHAHLQGDTLAQAKRTDQSTLADARQRPSALEAAYPDLERITAATSAAGKGRFYFIQSEKDTLADPTHVRDLVSRLGDRATLQTLPGSDHALTGSPGNPERVLQAAAWLAK